MEDEWITKPKKQKSPSSQSSKKSSPPAKRLAKKSPSASKGMQQSIDTFFSRAKKTDESQSESQSTPTKLNDTISPNKRKHEGDEEESPKRRKIEKTPEKTQEIDMTPVEDEVSSHKEFLDTFFGSDDEGETNRSPTKFPKKKEDKREEQDSLFDSSDDEKKTNNNNNNNRQDEDSEVEGESIKSSSESLFSQEEKDEPSDDFMETAKPGQVSAATTQSYETVHVDPSAPVQRKKAYKKKKNVPADATAAEMIEKSKPKPAPKPPRSALPALIKGPSDPALLASSNTLVDATPTKPASTETKKTPPAAQSKTSPTTKQSDAFIDACANSLAFEAFKQAVYDPKHQYICWSVIDKVDGNIFRRIESPQKVSEKSVAVREARGIVIYPTKANKPYFVNLKPSAPKDDNVDFVPLEQRYNFLIEFLESDKIKNKICYDTKNALKPLFAHNMKIRPRNLLDPQIAAWVYSPEDESYHFLALVEKYLAEKIEQPTLFTSPYAILFKDMMLCFRLMVHLEALLEKEGLMKIFVEQEMAVVPILSKMEIWGMGFDNEELLKCEQTLQKKLLDLQNEAERVTGQSVPLTSPQRISAILFDKLRLKPETKKERVGKKGQQSTNEAVLKTLQKQHPLPGIVLQHRHIQKMLTNWIETLDKKQIKGRIHTTLLHVGTATGRLSSQNPNLQNLPRTAQTFSLESNTDKDKEKDKEAPAPVVVNVRDAFVAAEGYVLLAADYSQLEMRLMAHIAKDQTLKTFFNSGKDVHTLVASHWRKKPVDQVTSTEREQAKRLVYGIMYGMGPNSLSEILDVTKKEAKEFIDSFLQSYPEVNEFIEETRREAHKNKSVRTITNRRRLLPGINGEDANKAERQAVNTVIQGTAADVVKMAMIKVDEKIHDSTTRLLLQIHDELIYEVEEQNVEELAKILKSTMESVIELDVPLPVNLKMGKRWGSMKGLAVK